MKPSRSGAGKGSCKGGGGGSSGTGTDRNEDDVEWLQAANRRQAREISYLKEELEDLHMKLLKAERRIRELVAKTALEDVAPAVCTVKKTTRVVEESSQLRAGDAEEGGEARQDGSHGMVKAAPSGLNGHGVGKGSDDRWEEGKQAAMDSPQHGPLRAVAKRGGGREQHLQAPVHREAPGQFSQQRTSDNPGRSEGVKSKKSQASAGPQSEGMANGPDNSAQLPIPSFKRKRSTRSSEESSGAGASEGCLEGERMAGEACLPMCDKKVCEGVGETGKAREACTAVVDGKHMGAGTMICEMPGEGLSERAGATGRLKQLANHKTEADDRGEESGIVAGGIGERSFSLCPTPSVSMAGAHATPGLSEAGGRSMPAMEGRAEAKASACGRGVSFWDMNRSPPGDVVDYLSAACSKAIASAKEQEEELTAKRSLSPPEAAKRGGLTGGLFASIFGGSGGASFSLPLAAAMEAKAEPGGGASEMQGRGRVLHLLQEQCRMLEEKKAAKVTAAELAARDRQVTDAVRGCSLSAKDVLLQEAAGLEERANLGPPKERQFLEACGKEPAPSALAGRLSQGPSLSTSKSLKAGGSPRWPSPGGKGEAPASADGSYVAPSRALERLPSGGRWQPLVAPDWAVAKAICGAHGVGKGAGGEPSKGGVGGQLADGSGEPQSASRPAVNRLDWATVFESYAKAAGSTAGPDKAELERLAKHPGLEKILFSWAGAGGLAGGLESDCNGGLVRSRTRTPEGGEGEEQIGHATGLTLGRASPSQPLRTEGTSSLAQQFRLNELGKRKACDWSIGLQQIDGQRLGEHYQGGEDREEAMVVEEGGPDKWTLGMQCANVEGRAEEVFGRQAKRLERDWVSRKPGGPIAEMEAPEGLTMDFFRSRVDHWRKFGEAGDPGGLGHSMAEAGPPASDPEAGLPYVRRRQQEEAPRGRGLGEPPCADFWARAAEREKGSVDEERATSQQEAFELRAEVAKEQKDEASKGRQGWQIDSYKREGEAGTAAEESAFTLASMGSKGVLMVARAIGHSPVDIAREHGAGAHLSASKGQPAGSQEGGRMGGTANGGSIQHQGTKSRFLSSEQWENLKVLALGEYEKKKGRPHVVKGALHYGAFLQDCVDWAPGVWLSASVLLGAYHRWAQTHPSPHAEAFIKNLQQQAMILGPLGLDLKKKHFHCGSRLRTVGMNYRGITLRPSALALAAVPPASPLAGTQGEADTETEGPEEDTVEEETTSEMPSDTVGCGRSAKYEDGKGALAETTRGTASSSKADAMSEQVAFAAPAKGGGAGHGRLRAGKLIGQAHTPQAFGLSICPPEEVEERYRDDAAEEAQLRPEHLQGKAGGGKTGMAMPGRGLSSAQRGPSNKADRISQTEPAMARREFAVAGANGGHQGPLKVAGVVAPPAFGEDGIPPCVRRILKAVGCKSVPEIGMAESPRDHRERGVDPRPEGGACGDGRERCENRALLGNASEASGTRSREAKPRPLDAEGGGRCMDDVARSQVSSRVEEEGRASRNLAGGRQAEPCSARVPLFSSASKGAGKGVVRLPGSKGGPIGEQSSCHGGAGVGRPYVMARANTGAACGRPTEGTPGSQQKPSFCTGGKARPIAAVSGAESGTGSTMRFRPAASTTPPGGCTSTNGTERWRIPGDTSGCAALQWEVVESRPANPSSPKRYNGEGGVGNQRVDEAPVRAARQQESASL